MQQVTLTTPNSHLPNPHPACGRFASTDWREEQAWPDGGIWPGVLDEDILSPLSEMDLNLERAPSLICNVCWEGRDADRCGRKRSPFSRCCAWWCTNAEENVKVQFYPPTYGTASIWVCVTTRYEQIPVVRCCQIDGHDLVPHALKDGKKSLSIILACMRLTPKYMDGYILSFINMIDRNVEILWKWCWFVVFNKSYSLHLKT